MKTEPIGPPAWARSLPDPDPGPPCPIAHRWVADGPDLVRAACGRALRRLPAKEGALRRDPDDALCPECLAGWPRIDLTVWP